MIIKCKLSTRRIVEVEVSPSDHLYKLLDLLGISDKDTKFTFNQKTYSMDSIQTFQSIGMNYSASIVVFNQAISGGGEDSSKFSNLSDEFIRRDNVSAYNPNIPPWRIIGKGINLYGICKNERCRANGKQVIMHVRDKQYDIYNEGFMGICPMCQKHFDLDTCSFYKCDYKCEGTYFDKYKDDWVNLPDEIKKTSGGKDFYYDYNKVVDKKEGKVKYKKLIVKVINYHEYE